MGYRIKSLAKEQGTFLVDVSFLDEDGEPLTPKVGTLSWTLSDVRGVIVNNRLQVPITSSSSVTVVLSGLDLEIGPQYLFNLRKLLFEGLYDSTAGTNLPLKEEVTFEIEDFAAV